MPLRVYEEVSLKITVTQDDINNGAPTSCACPIALAVRRMFPGAFISVGMLGIYIHYLHTDSVVNDKRYRATPRVLEFIRHFDAGIPVQPATFDVLECED
jgi:hypothetical protein